MRILFFIALMLGFMLPGVGQKPEFRPPMDIPLFLSGSFGELRGNHFHSGIDIRTRGRIGFPIYAIADGYVSRIHVQPYGFGHALYINHPSGHTSVYAHLDRFNEDITRYIRSRQYEQESFTVNTFPARNQFRVQQGDIIGYSGNSGSSGGPHLHFEIRDARDQRPVNPLSYGYDLQDNIYPEIQRLRLYPVGEGSTINGTTDRQTVYIFSRGRNIRPAMGEIEVSGHLAIGVQAIDQLEGSTQRIGPYRVTMYVDSTRFWEFKADRFSFGETRYKNSLIDYASYQKDRHNYYKSYLKPGNQVSLLAVRDNGLIHFRPGEKRTIRVEVADFAGNVSAMEFQATGVPKPNIKESQNELNGQLFHHNKNNRFANNDVRISIPSGALYDTLDFIYRKEEMPPSAYSHIHHLHNNLVPLHKHATVQVKVERMVNNSLKNKLLLVHVDHRKRKRSMGGTWKNGWVTARTRSLGTYMVMADTTAPVIRPRGFYPGKKLDRNETIDFTVTDDLSGVNYYRGEVNGQWVLFQYDPKNNHMFYELDHRVREGENNLVLTVSDAKGNRAVYRAKFHVR